MNFSLGQFCLDYIHEILPPKSIILELGSGGSTGLLAKTFQMYSVENDWSYLDRYDSTYIYAPIIRYDEPNCHRDYVSNYFLSYDCKPESNEFVFRQNNNGWYDLNSLILPEEYDMILIDGPHWTHGRGGFYQYLDLFNANKPMVFDDVNRIPERVLIEKISATVGREFEVFDGLDGSGKVVGTIK